MRRWVIVLIVAILIPTIAIGTSVVDYYADKTDDDLTAMFTSLTDEMRTRGLAAYISPSGGKYHKKPNCSSMDAALTVTVEEAAAAGFEPCKKCFKPKKTN